MIRNLSDAFRSSFPEKNSTADDFIESIHVRLIGCGLRETAVLNVSRFILPTFLMVYHQRGIFRLHHGEQTAVLQPGSFYLFKPYEIYSGERVGGTPLGFLFLQFDLTPFAERFSFGKMALSLPDSLYLEERYRRLGQALAEMLHSPLQHSGQAAMLREFVKFMAAQVIFDLMQRGETQTFFKNNREARLINQAFLYTAEHLSEPIVISRIVQETYTSKTTFDRAFRKTLNLTPQQALTRFKLERAMEMMQENVPLRSIAQELGFSSVYHFSNTFKSLIGQRPTEYKKKVLG